MKKQESQDKEPKNNVNPDWVLNQYNDNRDVFQKSTGKVYKQHRKYDLICYNLTNLYKQGLSMNKMADYYEVDKKTMLRFVRRNGFERMAKIFEFVFLHQKRLDDKGYNNYNVHEHTKSWAYKYPKVKEYTEVKNHIQARPFDVERAAYSLSTHYTDVKKAWEAYLETSGINDYTYLEIYIYWNNVSHKERSRFSEIDKLLTELLNVYEMIKNDLDDESIQEYFHDELADKFDLDLDKGGDQQE